MNQKDTNLICCMKTTVFMIFCVLAFSTARDSGQGDYKRAALTPEVRHTTWQAIQNPANHFITDFSVHSSENKNPFGVNYKFDFTSRLIHQRLITLGKNRETIIPLHTIRYYLKLIPANKDDLPDLS